MYVLITRYFCSLHIILYNYIIHKINKIKDEDDSIYEITSYGFDKDTASVALSICNNDVVKAMQYIIDQKYVLTASI